MSSEPECQICGNYIYYGKVICWSCKDKYEMRIKNEMRKENNRVLGELYDFVKSSSKMIDLNGETGDESADMVDVEEICEKIKFYMGENNG
jgi:hypothetical protein